MLQAIRHHFTGRAGRMMILLLALALWPMASFGAMDCCVQAEAEATAVVAVASDAHAHHGMHGSPHDATGQGAGDAPAVADCHESGVSQSPASHAACDSECAARCATPSLVFALAAWPAQTHAHQPRARWHASVPPRPQGTRLLRPPIHA